jgi:glycosyltransferase involved in cell wall biosynthesis
MTIAPVTGGPPLVTFAIFAFNQEAFIREAVLGAFSQTYSPLEIIISDDCSSDGTFAIITEMAAAYQGPHKVIARRNPVNLGVGEHVNEMARVASGEILVLAAGDDVSLPSRAAAVAETFRRFPTAKATLSAYETMPEGVSSEADRTPARVTQEHMLAGFGGVQKGATYAYAKECFTWPRPLPAWVVSEDRVLPFRAAMLGSVHYIPEPLIRYRLTGTIVDEERKRKRFHSRDDGRHLELLRETIAAARTRGLIGRVRSAYLFALARLLEASVRTRRSRKLAPLAPVLTFPIKLTRKLSPLWG